MRCKRAEWASRAKRVLTVVLEVVLLHHAQVRWELGVVKSVVHAIVNDVHCKRARYDAVGDSGGEDGVDEFSEGGLEDKEKQRWHDETQAVHGEVVVNSVHEEVQHQEYRSVWEEIVDVEQESVHAVFENRPDDNTQHEAG